jgi:hypothetical protein
MHGKVSLLQPAWHKDPMKIKISFALALIALSLLCVDSMVAAETPVDTLIVLQRGACEQRCAVYRVAIFSDGTVIYEGRYFVRRAGLVKSLISSDVLDKLVNDLEAADLFQLQDNYGYGNKDQCQSFSAGEPSAILTFSYRGHAKTILHNHGCAGSVPNRLTELEDKIDRAVGTAKWIK